MKFEQFKVYISDAARTVCNKTDRLAANTKITLDIESQKRKLAKTYEKIGENVVCTDIAEIAENTVIAELISKAKTEKDALKKLYEKKKELSLHSDCPCCGREGIKGEFCKFCGEYLK